MTYYMGASGLGHWVRRLRMTLDEINNELVLLKAAGTRSYEDRRDELERYEISRDNYFSIKAGEMLPEAFFDGLDVVYVASPNQFHKDQTMQALRSGKVTVTEKTFATSKEDFDEVINFIKGKHEGRVTLGLHYITKTLSIELGKLMPSLVEQYGKVRSVSASFFEEVREEDARRKWLFKPENGGIAIDWIHPISIISFIMKADRLELQKAKPYIVQKMYDEKNPSGFYSLYKISGRFFQEGATAVIRVAKGVDSPFKVFRINFEDAYAELLYISTDDEFLTGKRGRMEISERGKVVKVLSPKGPLSYQYLINDMLHMLKGEEPMLSLQDIIKMYQPEWQLQDALWSEKPLNDTDEIEKFIEEGIKHKIS
ncbi:MAG: Gfo/Idh/MocA family oxidoreductase [Conexivisphaerales archaeon]